ncbi:MAG: transcriptional regulator [Cyclobacteriaceae bacterium]|nr:MAG: transcriptional regulator [Cyclobacteriaceae bacterium]
MNITITQLEYVVSVNKYRNFAKAAARCYITQPTLSMQIKKLEQQLGILIFDRSRKPVKPTKLGEKVIAQAIKSLESLSKIQEIIQDSKGEIAGGLRIGVIPTLAPYLLPRFVTKLVKKYPKTQLIIEELLSDQILDRLDNDHLDIGIMVPPVSSMFKSIPLFREEFMLYFSSNHKLKSKKEIAVKDLDTNDMWLLKEGHCFRDQVELICGKELEQQTTRSIQFESGSLETLKNIIDHKVGFTLLPQLATVGWSVKEKQRLRRFTGEKPVREVCLVLHRGFLKEGLIKVLTEEIIASLPREIAKGASGNLVKWKPKSDTTAKK